MAKLYNLKIENFRGIKTFEECFYRKGLICFAGRGDTGKSTILESISKVLSPYWNLKIYEEDFYKGDSVNDILIEAVLFDLPDSLLKGNYGMSIIGINKNGELTDDLSDIKEKAIRIRLLIDSSMEPTWVVVNTRSEETYNLSSSVRSELGAFLISEYTDTHFSWGKNTPLSTILKRVDPNSDLSLSQYAKIVKNSFSEDSNINLLKSIQQTKESVQKMGVNYQDPSINLDSRAISIRNNSISLYDGEIPFRMKGKGSKRLWSIGIQDTVAQDEGLILIDEIEQGLEPDRIKSLVRGLITSNKSQTFITTHSPSVIEELPIENIFLVKNNDGVVKLNLADDYFQSLYRVCPDAIYSKKVIVCEGPTEIGICRALDEERFEKGLGYISSFDTTYTNGNGSELSERAMKLCKLGLEVAVFCDSDNDDDFTISKDDMRLEGISIFDYQKTYSTEDQIFSEVNINCINELLQYVIDDLGEQAVIDSINANSSQRITSIPFTKASEEVRKSLGLTSKKKKWFKTIGKGEFLGRTVLKNKENDHPLEIYSIFDKLNSWINGKD